MANESEEFNHAAHKTAWIAVKNLSVIWAASQRDFDPKHSKRIADAFDPEMFGVLSVTLPNGEGIYHIIDGQHRKDAVQQLFGENEKVPCVIFNARDPSRAAVLFDKINTARKAPRPIDRFRVRVTARYKDECGVARIINQAGYTVGAGGGKNVIRCVDACIAIYKTFSPPVLAETLGVIRSTFGDDQNAVDAKLVRGYGKFLGSFAGNVDMKRLIEVVQQRFTPGKLVSAAKAASEINHTNISSGIAHVLLQHYNKKLRNPLTDADRVQPQTRHNEEE